jgi:hypothetical protein
MASIGSNIERGQIAAEISRRAEITTTDWQGTFRKSRAPFISFFLKNAGLTHAHIVRVTYEYSISRPLPKEFGPATEITEKFGMLGPDNKVFVSISDIRPFDSDELSRFEKGQLFVYARVTIFYQDIFAQIYRNRFTARFGMFPDRGGALAAGFDFPEVPTPIENWGDGARFRNFRCLNYHERWGQAPDPDCDKKQSGSGSH